MLPLLFGFGFFFVCVCVKTPKQYFLNLHGRNISLKRMFTSGEVSRDVLDAWSSLVGIACLNSAYFPHCSSCRAPVYPMVSDLRVVSSGQAPSQAAKQQTGCKTDWPPPYSPCTCTAALPLGTSCTSGLPSPAGTDTAAMYTACHTFGR